jgi:hypothetical protein
MRPCVFGGCPALATRGDYCPVHAEAVEPVPAAETAAAIAQRDKIAGLYRRRFYCEMCDRWFGGRGGDCKECGSPLRRAEGPAC